ncbi:hypothetical protein CP061683_0666A, partial [Chlamydia psittaci 06-1683]
MPDGSCAVFFARQNDFLRIE